MDRVINNPETPTAPPGWEEEPVQEIIVTENELAELTDSGLDDLAVEIIGTLVRVKNRSALQNRLFKACVAYVGRSVK